MRSIYCILLIALFTAPAGAARRPNVLFIVCDDLNTQAIGAYGSTVCKTPNIDKLAARGVKFDRAYCQWPLCGPSRNSFLSGKRPDGRFPMQGYLKAHVADVTFLPEHFRNNGYFTARVGKIFHASTILNGAKNWEDPACWDVSEVGGTKIDPCGYAVWFATHPKCFPANPELHEITADHANLNTAGNPGYDYFMEYAALNVSDEETIDGNIAKRITELMEQAKKGDKPFFLAAGFRRPHLMWVAPKKYFDMYPPEKIELPKEPADDLADIPKLALTRGAPKMTDDQRRKAIASYYACVSYVDAQLGVLTDALDRLALADNTIVVFTSDHGWHLGQHGLWGKVTLFQESARVPLIVRAPAVTTTGGASPRSVEMLDIYPTLCALAGIAPPEGLDGLDLSAQLKNPQSPRDRPAFSIVRKGKQWGRAVYTERHRYTEWGEGASDGVELYDHERDPREHHNVARDPAHAELLKKLKAQLDRETKTLAPLPTDTGD